MLVNIIMTINNTQANTDNKVHLFPAFYPKKRDKLSYFLQSDPAP